MATVNNVVVANWPAASAGTNGIMPQVWKLTRALKRAGWKYVASSDGSLKETTGNPASDYWNGGSVGAVTGSGSGASIASPTRGRATVSGLTGITAADKGKFLVISGSSVSANNNAHQIEEIVSATQVRIDARTFAVAADAGPRAWEVRDPNASTLTNPIAAGTTAWWCARGPSILQIPITAAPVAGVGTGFNFIRGENLVQATTGAEAEIRGWVFDSTSGTGYLVVHPRLRGTGGNPYGWATGNVITGSLSGATVTQVGTVTEYRAEIVVWKGSANSTGSVLMGWFDPVGDAADMFSTAAKLASAGCTATVPPGGGGTGNALPTYGWALAGSSTGASASLIGTSATTANAQIIVADCIEEQGLSMDGSFLLAMAQTNLSTACYTGMWFQILDDTEDGDLAPYVSGFPGVKTLYNFDRTTAGISAAVDIFSQTENQGIFGGAQFNTSLMGWRGWFRRGLAATPDLLGNAFCEYEVIREISGVLFTPFSSQGVFDRNPAYPMPVASAYSVTKYKGPVKVACSSGSRNHRKGSCRHMFLVQSGQANNTYENGSYVQLSSSANGCVIAGPWDGISSSRST